VTEPCRTSVSERFAIWGTSTAVKRGFPTRPSADAWAVAAKTKAGLGTGSRTFRVAQEDAWLTPDGHFHRIRCTCGEVIQDGPAPTAEDAKALAYGSWWHHLHAD
jgi:hypothetical protein